MCTCKVRGVNYQTLKHTFILPLHLTYSENKATLINYTAINHNYEPLFGQNFPGFCKCDVNINDRKTAQHACSDCMKYVQHYHGNNFLCPQT